MEDNKKILGIDFERAYKRNTLIHRISCPNKWILISPATFNYATGIKLTFDQLDGMRELVYGLRAYFRENQLFKNLFE